MEGALERAKEAERRDLLTLLARFHSAVGVELFNAGEGRQAEDAFRAALGHAEDSYAHFGLGFLHFVRLEDPKALEHLAEAARLEPTHGKTQKLLALIDYRQGRLAPALTKMREARSLDPADAESGALLARWDLESRWTGSFHEQENGRFFLRVDPDLPGSRLEEVSGRLEKARRDIAERLSLGDLPPRSSRGTRRITVVLFSEKRFHAATGSLHWVGGVFDGQIKLPVKPGRDAASEAELEAAVRHEMSHFAIRELGPECPNWLNEGIAQHFERAGQTEAVKARLLEGAARRVSLKNIPSRLWEVEDEELARWSYLQGLGFVEFLSLRYLPFRLRLCLEAITRERSVSKAFEVTYGAPFEELEALWWKEIKGG